MTEPTDEAVATIVAWSPIYVTLVISIIQGLVFFLFFATQRNKDSKIEKYDLFEPRQFTRGHRSPPPFDGGSGMFAWARAAWNVPDDECLNYVGLDSYMFLRFLRLAARMTVFGTFLAIILIPIYATAEASGPATEAFNQLTLARVAEGSKRLWATVICWWSFIAFILYGLWNEWKLYSLHRYSFLAKGDVDTPPDFRYAVRVENIPSDLRSNQALRTYFEHLFPNQVRQVAVCLFATKLDGLIEERNKHLCAYEKAVAFTRAKPNKPVPMVKTGAKLGLCGGTKVEAIPFHAEEIKRLNNAIDIERASLYKLADGHQTEKADHVIEQQSNDTVEENSVEVGWGNGQVIKDNGDASHFVEEDEPATDGKASSTAFITLTSLRAKQAAVQCEISGKKDCLDTFPVSDPEGVLWENVTTPVTRQTLLELATSCFWILGLLFWAVPVTFVTSIANLNGILQTFGLPTADPSAVWYGLVAGLLPVIALKVLMIVLFMGIVIVAKKVVRKKSMPEVDAYTLFWHQLYQFANLWLILIGGSFFNQMDSILNGKTDIFVVISKAIPGASVFFMNMIAVGSFGGMGLELSLLPTFGVKLIMSLIQPEALRTQRALDAARKPPSISWAKQIPGMIFVYLVAILYMPIVPIVEIFALLYFGGWYIVYKHQCLHVYATPFEGGGETTWQCLFGFLMAALYMSECVFIAYMGLKGGSTQAALGIVPLVATTLVHVLITRNVSKPLQNLSLEVAARVDEAEGEMPIDKDSDSTFSGCIEYQLYGQPGLKPSLDEREPLPYRRSEVTI